MKIIRITGNLRSFFALLALTSIFLLGSSLHMYGQSGTIVVGNKSGNTVSFIDRSTGKTITTLPTGVQPHEVEVSGGGRWAVVANYGDRENPGNTLSVYNVKQASQARTIELGKNTRPHGLDWIPGTSKILVTTEGSKKLLVVDVKEGEILKALDTRREISHMVAVTPDGQRAFVSSIRSGDVTVFSLPRGERLAQLYSGKGAEGLAVSPDGKEVWVTNRADNTLAVFDAKSLERIETLSCGDFPIRAKFSPNGRYFVVSNAQSGDVAIFHANNKKLIKKIQMRPPVPEDKDPQRYFSEFEGTSVPIGVVVPDNRTAYISNTRSDVVTVIDLGKLTIRGHYEAGKEPDGINFSPLLPE
ncbi:MAG: beta-propeller fold lactonase family protein [Bacteroidales bacterium]|nr:beta-propeller fold lactonase family protein [Bacteroidales bacterium]